LADVNQLAGTFADDMDIQQRAGFGVKDQLQQRGAVAHNLAARDLAVLLPLHTSDRIAIAHAALAS
jgi:hypothetical protein